jgi:hypothetical protein
MIASSGGQPGSATNGDTRSSGGAAPGSRPGAQDPHPLEPLLAQLAMLREFALHYVEAQKDAISSAARRALLKAVLGVFAAIVGATLLITSTVLVALGLAQLISIAADGRAWVGNLAIGGGVLLIVGAATAFYVSRALSAARKRMIEKYELRHTAQRAKYGADVPQKAAL